VKTQDPEPEPAPDADAGTEQRLTRIASGLLYWLPVAVPMVLFAQISFRGLRPALHEREHLALMREEIEARYDADLALYDDLGRRHRARLDPVFRERQRRLSQGPWTGQK